jgi:hypothetical protein
MIERLSELISTSTHLRIATAYIGEPAIIRLLPAFRDLVQRGAIAQIYIGRALTEGLFQDTLSACSNLHNLLHQTGGGVYATNISFHSKIYSAQENGQNTILIGSSNLSVNGLIDWREANLEISANLPIITNILDEINFIAASAVSLAHVDVVARSPGKRRIGRVRRIQEYPAGPKATKIEVLELPLYSRSLGEVQGKSGLNWWNAGGRPRHHDEACIALSVKDIRNNLNFFSNRANRGTNFSAYTDDGRVIEMSIEGNGPPDNTTGNLFGKQIASSNHISIFGEWILRDKLNLAPNTLVTRQILQNYGRETIEIIKINNTEYIMRF